MLKYVLLSTLSPKYISNGPVFAVNSGFSLSTLIVVVSVEVKPAWFFVVKVTTVPSVFSVILDTFTVFVTGPDTSSLPPVPEIVTFDVYHPFEPSVPTISNVPTVGAVLSTLTT